MIPDPDYMGGLEMPDLRPHFKHLHWRVMGHSFGRLVASDWADKPDDDQWRIWKQCGLWCREEAAILYHCARTLRNRGTWVDIGAHTGWTSKHLQRGSRGIVECIDPMLANPCFSARFSENTGLVYPEMNLSVVSQLSPITSDEYFAAMPYQAPDGYVIDGDHLAPHPLHDAQNAAAHLRRNGVILLHDVIGPPVQEAVRWLQDNGFRTRIYLTPHVVACCWRGEFTPPVHIPEPALVDQNLPARMPMIDWTRCE